jgi:16S rRNA (guanine527-N7)-methyltransferase
MSNIELIKSYFLNLSEQQIHQFERLKEVYTKWNDQINVISRKDMDEFIERHVLHSLAIAKVIQFSDNSRILDVGTGGGFPGVPLAILFPKCHFTLVDSIGKKIKVVSEVCDEIGITNVKTYHMRAENVENTFDFVVSRAVTAMPVFIKWIQNKFNKQNQNSLNNGVLYLKGGDLNEEMKGIQLPIKYYPIADYFKEEFFETKKVVYIDFKKKSKK